MLNVSDVVIKLTLHRTTDFCFSKRKKQDLVVKTNKDYKFNIAQFGVPKPQHWHEFQQKFPLSQHPHSDNSFVELILMEHW